MANPITLGSVINVRNEQVEATKARLVKTLIGTVLEKIEIPIAIHDIGDEIDVENEIAEILLSYKFDKHQVLDLTELLFYERVNHLILEDGVMMDNHFGQAYHDYVQYYLAGHVTKYLLKEINSEQ